MSKLPKDVAQLPLCFENSVFPVFEEDHLSPQNSNVVNLGVRLRIVSSKADLQKNINERDILNSVLLEAKKLNW